jgi:Tol biopolymer transport system component
MAIGVRPTTLWRVSLEGGQPAQLTQGESVGPVVSPDGSRIAFSLSDDPTLAKWRLAVMPAAGGSPTHTFEYPTPFARRLRWAPDGTAVTYAHNVAGVYNLWSQPLSGGPPQQITDFKSDVIYGFDWSRDGKMLALSRGQFINDVVLLRGFR